jgi:ABC-2 type transport system ATP-binding protein
MSIAIEAVELSHYYNLFPAVDKISFQVKGGTVFGLLGPNGAGKSTTIKMLTTLLPPTSGSAQIMGYDLVHDSDLIRQRIGYVPQLLSADGDLTGYENLSLSAKLYGLSRAYRIKRIREVLEFMGLEDFGDRLVSQYSGGMIRKLEIAQALLHSPDVLFLDEPTVGLDPAARKTLWHSIQEWRKNFKTTILITTHDMDEADRLCDVVAFMHLGRIVVLDAPSKLKATIGPHATLDDVFIKYTGTSINPSVDYNNVKQTRRTISHLD